MARVSHIHVTCWLIDCGVRGFVMKAARLVGHVCVRQFGPHRLVDQGEPGPELGATDSGSQGAVTHVGTDWHQSVNGCGCIIHNDTPHLRPM